MANAADYRDIARFLDTSDAYENSFSELNLNGARLLVVTQKGEFDGGQIIFRWNGTNWIAEAADTFIDVTGNEERSLAVASKQQCSRSSEEDHKKVFEHVKSQVGKFSSKSGPDGGNLACVWTVRHLCYEALKRWITKTDGTAVFEPELSKCLGNSLDESEVLPGGIIISPTVTSKDGTRIVGHVGFLGEGTGAQRPIYSNSSKLARLEKNFTIESWEKRYKEKKGLSVKYYALPVYGGVVSS